MFKILIALSLFIAIQGQLIGGYTDHPELVRSAVTRNMVKLAVAELEKKDNLQVSPIDVVSVATQVVDGLNFRVVFTANQSTSTDVLLCTTVVYQTIAGAQSVSSVQCA